MENIRSHETIKLKNNEVLILGGGPAGITAAIYLKRSGYDVVIIEKEELGGQIRISNEVVNYPGIMHTDGLTLAQTMKDQAKSFSAQFVEEKVVEIKVREKQKGNHEQKKTDCSMKDDHKEELRQKESMIKHGVTVGTSPADVEKAEIYPPKVERFHENEENVNTSKNQISILVRTDKNMYEANCVIYALGAVPRKLHFKGEKELTGKGIAYCAVCDGELYKNKTIFVVGGGYAAVEEAIYLTRYTSPVTMIVREPDFTCAKEMAEAAKNNPHIQIEFNTVIDKVEGEDFVKRVMFYNSQKVSSWSQESSEPIGIFIFAGYEPETNLLKGLVTLTEEGYIVTDKYTRTSQPGIYAAGDVCEKELRQLVSAVYDGAAAAETISTDYPL